MIINSIHALILKWENLNFHTYDLANPSFSHRNEWRGHGKCNQNTRSELPASIDFKEMGFLMVVLLSMSCLSFGSKITSVATYDVTSYGAKGDGNTVTPV
uniref:Uncharacterized protein n=1 Tax=Lactuca sativa TaxID=4236 RepID=A0A9R1X607_LACSA|nr:hypothetical protein LSAT_V11C600307110 [Lactuca sativa]